MKTFHDKRGNLAVINFNELPFIPVRLFFVNNVPKHSIRGEHAHFKTEQYLICYSGEILVYTFDGNEEKKTILYAGDFIFIDKMIWSSIKYLTNNCVLLVLANTPYDKSDYIEDIEKFKELTK